MITRPLLVLLIASCAARQPPPTTATTAALVVPCASPRAFGAIPDDNVDDRAPVQQALDACGGSVIDFEAGRYLFSTPPMPRPRADLVMRAGAASSPTVIRGVDTSTEFLFTGDNMLGEWRGIQLASHVKILHIKLKSNLTKTVEQSHMIRGDGPLVDVEIGYVSCSHPQVDGKVGDCVNLAGYPPLPDGKNDRRIWDVTIHHSVFEESGRSGIAFHSGVHGSIQLWDGHSTTRWHHNTFRKISDQPIDGEVGSGESDNDGIEIDHNTFEPRAGAESSVAIQIQTARRVWIHDNLIAGNVDLYGCDACGMSDNDVTLSSSSGSPVVHYRKSGSGTAFRDELWTRDASAGTGYVFAAAQKLTAPHHMTMDDVTMVQRTPMAAVYAWGIVGLAMRHLTVLSDWSAPMKYDAIQISGSASSLPYQGIRTSEILLSDSYITGPYVSGIAVGSSYAGTGSVTVERNWSSGVGKGLRCDNPMVGAEVTGPVIYLDNRMPAAACDPLIP